MVFFSDTHEGLLWNVYASIIILVSSKFIVAVESENINMFYKTINHSFHVTDVDPHVPEVIIATKVINSITMNFTNYMNALNMIWGMLTSGSIPF